MDDEKTLINLKRKIEDIKAEVSSKEGEKKVFLQRLKKEFEGIGSEDPYTRLKEISAELEVKEEKRHSLVTIAQERLEGYGG